MPMPLLMQCVSVVGMIGMNALAVLVFCLPALLAARNAAGLACSLAVVLVAAHVGFGFVRLARAAGAAGAATLAGAYRPARRST